MDIKIATSEEKIRQLRQWIDDLQSGMYVNCVYCGHRYGPAQDTPVAMADVLKAHIAECSEHPMSKMRIALVEIRGLLEQSPQQTHAWLFTKISQVVDSVLE